MLNLVDKLILLYEAALSLHVFLFKSNIPDWHTQLHLNLIITIWVLFSSWTDKQFYKEPFKFTHTFYPVFLLIWYYPQACELRHSVNPSSLDSVISAWDLALFRVPLYDVLPHKLNLFGMELFHFFYFSYYLMIGIPAWIVYKKKHSLINEYLFVIMITNIIHQWFIIFIPADGPVPLRSEIIPDGFLFIPIMNLIYKLDAGGGAFPSLHVAGAFIMCAYAYKFLPGWKYFWIVLFCLITISTVICCYHYPIDSLVGMFTGFLCYIYLPCIYEYITAK